MSNTEATCTELSCPPRLDPSKLEIGAVVSSAHAAADGLRVRQLEQEVEQLQLALARRPSIEHVLGMIMLMLSCDEDTAFATLSRISQNLNRKIHDLASLIRDFVAEGRPLPPDVAAALASMIPPGVPRSPELGGQYS